MTQDVQQLACQFHPEAVLIEDDRMNEIICPECGFVVSRTVGVGPEWRTFSDDKDSRDMCRVGAAENPLFDSDHFETVMSKGTGAGALDEFGTQKYINRPCQMSSTDKALRSGDDKIRQMADRINLTKRIRNRAFLLFKQCYETKCVRGRSQDTIIATCIYIACRKEDVPRTIEEICAISASTSKKDLGRCYTQIVRSLPDATRTEPIDIKHLMPRFCNRLQLHQENLIQQTAVHIAERAKEVCNLQSRAPTSIAAASIYMACAAAGERKSLKDIQVVVCVMESTIRQIYKIMLPKAAELFPSNFQFKCPLTNLPSS
jgi:transcription initiation factor TFIIB